MAFDNIKAWWGQDKFDEWSKPRGGFENNYHRKNWQRAENAAKRNHYEAQGGKRSLSGALIKDAGSGVAAGVSALFNFGKDKLSGENSIFQTPEEVAQQRAELDAYKARHKALIKASQKSLGTRKEDVAKARLAREAEWQAKLEEKAAQSGKSVEEIQAVYDALSKLRSN